MYTSIDECKQKCLNLHKDLYEKYVASFDELAEEVRNFYFQVMCQVTCDFESLNNTKFNPKFRRWFSEQLIKGIKLILLVFKFGEMFSLNNP